MEDRCLKRKKQASGISIFITEELGDARLRCNQLKDYINEAVELIEKSDKRDQFFEIAGHLLHGIPDTLMRIEKALSAAAMAVAKWDYEEIKDDLRPEKAEQLEDALKDVRTRRVDRRSSKERPMKTHQAAQELSRIAQSIENNGYVDTDSLAHLITALEGDGMRVASSTYDVARVLRSLAASLKDADKRPSRAVLASALRRVFAEHLEVASSAPPPLPGPGMTMYSLTDGFENIKTAAILAERRGERQPKLAFVNLASIIQEIGLMCELLGAPQVPELAARMSKAVLMARRLTSTAPDSAQSVTLMASEKTAANRQLVMQLLRAYHDGSKFGGFDVSDLHGSADRLELAANKCAKLAFQFHLEAPPTNLFKEIAGRMHDLAFHMGAGAADAGMGEADQDLRMALASEKTASSLMVPTMVRAFEEGVQFGDYQVRDVRGAADRLNQAARKLVHMAESGPMNVPTPATFAALSDRAYDLAFYMGSASGALARNASDTKESRFEEGKPADPTENMSEQDAEEWKTEHAKNKDKFKEAADESEDETKEAWTDSKAKNLVPKINKNKKYAEDDKLSRFEEGKPADPTENMSEDAADEWKDNTDKYEDKFKAASDVWKA